MGRAAGPAPFHPIPGQEWQEKPSWMNWSSRGWELESYFTVWGSGVEPAGCPVLRQDLALVILMDPFQLHLEFHEKCKYI